MVKLKYRIVTVAMIVLCLFSMTACSNKKSILFNCEAHCKGAKPPYSYYSSFYIQVSCEFVSPEDMYLESVAHWYGDIEQGFVRSQGVTFNENFTTMATDVEDSGCSNKYGIFVDGIDSKKLSSNLIDKDQNIKVIFPVYYPLYAEQTIEEGKWTVTMQAKDVNRKPLTNAVFGGGGMLDGIETYYLGRIPVKDIMVDDLIVEWDNL